MRASKLKKMLKDGVVRVVTDDLKTTDKVVKSFRLPEDKTKYIVWERNDGSVDLWVRDKGIYNIKEDAK